MWHTVTLMDRRVDHHFNDFIVLSSEEYEHALALSEATLATFRGHRGYYRNTSNSHLVGKVGEVAAASWFEDAEYSVVRLFEQLGQEQQCDLLCDGRRIEVKTWSARWWPMWGRCVAVGQLPALAAKADFVLWVTADIADATAAVRLQGWSSIDDVHTAPIRWTGPSGKEVQNHQLDAADLRPIAQLLER
jgi:hypothetical protein